MSSTTVETLTFQLQPRQLQFARTKADIAIYGGAAGGGKSYALLFMPIGCGKIGGRKHYQVRGFSGVIFRRSYPEISNPGGLWDQAGEIYPYAGGKPIVGHTEYRWPQWGTKIAFRHLEHAESVHDYQGAEICYLGFDELTHFTESQFWYLLSRNRSTCGVRPYVRATCNPDPGWVKSLLGPWVDDDFAGPRAQSGEIRHFVRSGGEICWVDPDTPDAKSLTFIKASVYDNAILLRANPEYLANLKALPPVEQARLLHGDWNVRRSGLVYPGFDACIVEHQPFQPTGGPEIGGIDFGFHNPFAAVWGHVDHDDVLWITGCRSVRQCTIPTHAEAIPRGLKWWCDPSGAESIAELRNLGHEAFPCVHIPVRMASGELKKPLLAGIDMVSRRIQSGRLKIVRRPCLPLIRSLGLYHYDDEKQSEDPVKEDDHEADALRYLIVGLDRGKAPTAKPSGADWLEGADWK